MKHITSWLIPAVFSLSVLILGLPRPASAQEAIKEPTLELERMERDLTDLRRKSMQTRLSRMERRVARLEQEQNFNEEKIRNLERLVDDLRRKLTRI